MTLDILLLGPPGAGKGTQGALLAQRLGLPKFATGDLLRDAVKRGTPLGLKAKAVMEAGNLVSDDIVLGMLEERLGKDDARAGFVLDGYPRNLAQARALEQLLARLRQPVDIAVQLDVDTALLVERIAGRAALEGRADDTPESVRNRLNVYNEQTAPVVDFYRQKGNLSCVDGVGSMDQVFNRIVEAMSPTSDVG
jgi:adenylate kinase